MKSDFIRSVDLKIARAKQQLNQLGNSIDNWVENNPITARCELRDQRLGFRLIQNDFAEIAPLDDWSLSVGEFVHNLRSSLDNLAFALARLHRDPPANPTSIMFPICSDRKQFEKAGRSRLNQLPREPAQLVELLQPFQGDGSPASGTPENDALVFLHLLNNLDKHRVPSVVLLAPVTLTHAMSIEFKSEEDAASNVPPDATIWNGPLHPGAILIEHRTKHPIVSVRGNCKGSAVASLLVNGNPMPVSPTLSQLGQYTELVIANFRKFFDQP